MIFGNSNNSSTTHVKKHKLYNVRQRAPQKLHVFLPYSITLQPFFLGLRYF